MHRAHTDRGKSVEELQLPAETGNVQQSRILVQAWTERADPHPSSIEESHQGLVRFCTRSTWLTALKMQALVVRNAAESIACAWVPNTFFVLGDVFSGKWYTDQSRDELLVSNSVYTGIGFCMVVFTSFLPMLMSLKFAGLPDRRPTLWFCIKRLVRATCVYFVAVMIIMFGFSYLIVHLDFIVPGLFKFKIDCYANELFLLGYYTGITRAVKQIYYEETQQGRDRLQQKQQNPRRSKIAPTDITAAATATQRTSFNSPPPRPHVPRFWRAYLKGLPICSLPLTAGLFVHVLSQQRIADRGNVVLTGFVVAGIIFKLTVQEIAKHYIFKKRVRSARVMCVLVGVPTVLIDTQTRIILLATNNTKTAVAGAIGMALIEISLRSGKAALVMWEIRRHNVAIGRKTEYVLQGRAILEVFKHQASKNVLPSATTAPRPSMSTRQNDFEMWRRQVHTFHTAEVNADMYAEYISIGCAASISFFYGNHPHYPLLRQATTAYTGIAKSDNVSWRVNQLKMLSFQIGVEVIVDYISTVMEIAIGIELDQVKNLGSFLGALFMVTAVMNITISIGFYLS